MDTEKEEKKNEIKIKAITTNMDLWKSAQNETNEEITWNKQKWNEKRNNRTENKIMRLRQKKRKDALSHS